ncbi:MAG: hypothetical protein QM741_15075 [Rudaea sp.]|uniref:hypothetical protein n=1 Tax=Rudaea sp. TaxID=2136325 RepID=UPI0039E45D5E
MTLHRSSLALACALLAVDAIGVARADTLLIDRVKQERSHVLPARGLSMAQVERRYGAPTSKLAPAGGDSRWHPTINRWVYADYTVYFERDRVIDAVVNRASPDEIGPKSAVRNR